jgi:hypothetical protein
MEHNIRHATLLCKRLMRHYTSAIGGPLRISTSGDMGRSTNLSALHYRRQGIFSGPASASGRKR